MRNLSMSTMNRRSFLRVSGSISLSAVALPGFLRAADPVPLEVLLFGGDLPAVRKDMEKEYAVRFLTGGVKPGGKEKEDNITGLEQLTDADLWIGSVAKRTFPSEAQLGHFKKFLEAGKPFVGYRAASHVFQNWLQVDKEVFGVKYGGHHLQDKEKDVKVELAKGEADHPILKGIEPPPPTSGSYVYTEVAPDVRVLLYSGIPGNMMPHTWVRENKKTKGRVFYTRYDAKELGSGEAYRKLFLRGIVWALGGDLSKHKKGAKAS